jgi:hypothetical protein
MKGTLVLLAVLFLAGQVTAASRGFVSRMRRNKGPRASLLRRPLDRK